MKSEIYLDNSATTAVYPQVVELMSRIMLDDYGNPSSKHNKGVEAEHYVTQAKETLASILKCDKKEILFTSGGTESDNMALIGCAMANKRRGSHIITTMIEHPAVLETAVFLERNGFEVTYLPVDSEGRITPEQLEAAIRPDTILVSIMTANNEIGTIEPIKELGRVAHEHGVLFHTDAVQAYGHIPINVDEMNIDMLSSSGHKINGPKGIGIMYARKTVKLAPFIHGGAQERGKRAGTLNTPGIVGFGAAAQLAGEKMEERKKILDGLREHLIERVLNEIPYSRLNGARYDRLPNNAHFCFRFIEGESMLIMLDMNGVCGSSGSACTSGSLDPSHVLLAIGLPHEIAHGSLRLTLSEDITMEQIDYTVDKLKEIVARLREMSPLYEDFVKNGEK